MARFRIFDGRDAHLDLAARQVGIDRLRRPRDDLAAHREHVLRARLLGERVRLGDARRVEHELDHAAAVAEVDEDEIAVVAPARDPAGETHLATDVGGAQLPRIGVAKHQEPFPRRAASPSRQAGGGEVLFPAAVHGAQAHEVGADLVEAEKHGERRAAAAGLLELALGAAPGEVQLGGQAGPAQLLGKAEGGGPYLVAETDDVHVGRAGRQRPVAHRQGDALEAAAPAHAGRGRAADLLDEPVVAAAAADAALRAEAVGLELEGGARVVVEAAHQAEVEVRLQTRPLHEPQDRVEVPATVGAQVVDEARRLVEHGAAALDLAVEGAQRIEVEPFEALAAELALSPAQVAAQRVDVGRAAGGVAHAVHVEPHALDAQFREDRRQQRDHLRVDRRVG